MAGSVKTDRVKAADFIAFTSVGRDAPASGRETSPPAGAGPSAFGLRFERRQEVIILGVRADPDPGDLLAFTMTQRTVMLAHPHRPKALAHRFKMQRGMPGILPPEGVIFISCHSRGHGQRLVAASKAVSAKGVQGKRRRVPFSRAARASSTKGAKLPWAASAAMRRSHWFSA